LSDTLTLPTRRRTAFAPTATSRLAAERPRPLEPTPRGAAMTVLVPAYNEAASIADTVKSLKAQTRAVAEIVVIDDCSTDDTAAVAAAAGATVMRPPKNTGSKAGAQNYALQFVDTPLCMAIDADTTLPPDAVEKIVAVLEETTVVAACGFVLPRYVKTVWERGRYVEYLFAFSFFKQIQEHYGKPLISSGCFSAYRTDVLQEMGGWSQRTLAEDMDLTWSFYEKGYEVRFVPEAVSYPIEPHNYHFMSCQLKRWSHGFLQNVKVHWRGILDVPVLRSIVGVTLWDALIASLLYLTVIPVFSVLINPLFLLGYVIDLPAVAVPVLLEARKRGEVGLALASLPCFAVLRVVNAMFIVRAAWSEFVMRRTFSTYVKGH
jgi:biofilm PGA synthesis N-glycosyltransferase PgaC